jgi:hypothetical protein
MYQECEEPRCRAPVTKEWHGRKVCDDHYDYFRDRFDRLESEGKE